MLRYNLCWDTALSICLGLDTAMAMDGPVLWSSSDLSMAMRFCKDAICALPLHLEEGVQRRLFKAPGQ
eukprot:1034294-Amphidinium_carterae.1